MSGKKTLVWVVVLLALSAFYYFYEMQGGTRRREAARQRELLVHVEVDKVTELTIKRPTETITGVKRQGQWQVTEPLTVPGDDQKYSELVRAVADLRFQRQIEDSPESLDPFGLTKPDLEIQIQAEATAEPLVVQFGAINPTGSGYYAQVKGQPALYLVSTSIKNTLDASLYDLRDKTVLAFETTDVQTIHVDAGEAATVVVQRQDTGEEQWRLTKPVRAPGDSDVIQRLLQRLREVKVQTFVADGATDLEPYGLHAPALRLALTVGKDQTVKSLLFGKLDPDQKGVYAKRQGADHVLLLPQQFWDDLPRTATALRDKTLWQFEREHIARIELQTADEEISLTRTGLRQYQIEKPVSAAGDGDAVYELLWNLKELKAKDFVAEAPSAAASYGLVTPRLRVTLVDKPADDDQEGRSYTVLFGDNAPNQAGTYVQLESQPTVYLVEQDAARRIMDTTAFDLRNKKLLAFDRDTVQKIHLQYPTSTFTLERRGDAWRVSEPEKQRVQQDWKVSNLLYELGALEYARIIAQTADNDGTHGLDTPQAQITLWQEDGMVIGPLSIGRIVDSGDDEARLVYAQVGPDMPLYAIQADFLDTLPKSPADFTDDK